jgi:hypothetical protein
VTFTVHNDPQRSPAWFACRVGRLTGSRAGDMLATIKSGEAAARRDLRSQLVTERLTGQAQEDGYVNAVMQRGIDLEPAAFAAYEAHTGHLARRTGFLAADDLMVGCSLDGDVDAFTGIVELKCPKSATHLRYLKSNGAVPSEHVAQITHNLWVSGAAWCDFASFDDRFPEPLRLVVIRVMRDESAIAEYAKKATAFLEEVDAECSALLTMANPVAQMEASIGV